MEYSGASLHSVEQVLFARTQRMHHLHVEDKVYINNIYQYYPEHITTHIRQVLQSVSSKELEFTGAAAPSFNTNIYVLECVSRDC